MAHQPLIVRELYHGSVDDLAFAMTSLTVGSIVGSIVILGRGGVRRKGRAFLLALLTVAFCLVTFRIASSPSMRLPPPNLALEVSWKKRIGQVDSCLARCRAYITTWWIRRR